MLLCLMVLIPFQVFATPFYNWDFNLAGHASHTYDYADVLQFNNVNLGFLDNYSWTHALPADFNPVYSDVTGAQLWISARGVLSDLSTTARVEGLCRWEFLEGQDWHWSWRWGVVYDESTSETVIDLPSSAQNYAFWENDPLHVTVGTNQMFSSVSLDQSVLMMDYSGGNNTSAVPEPATVALFALGLIGIVTTRIKLS